MNTTTTFSAIFCMLSFATFSQHQHEELEHLFSKHGVSDFEKEVGVKHSEVPNTAYLDFVDSVYQTFYQGIEDRVRSGEEISDADFLSSYKELAKSVSLKEDKFKNPGGIPFTPKAINGPCVNMDFETGDVSGWELTRGNVDGSGPYSYVSEIPVGPGGYHQVFGGGVDPVTGIPRVNPQGGGFSARLGNGTGVGARAARFRQTFLVDPTNFMFTYSYAVIFESPVGHALNQLPYFTVRVFDSLGNSVPCGEYSVIADAANAPDYESVIYGGSTILYKDWESVFTNLSAYIGQNVTVEFTAGDCSLTGHFGYAYIDASCGMSEVIASQSTICTGDSSILTAPPGAGNYLWSNGDTTQTTVVYAGGTYTCTLVPFQGGGCSIDLNITIDEFPTPIADFIPSTVVACPGEPITFTDQSSIPAPGIISSYQWDFGDGTISPPGTGAIVGVPNTTGTYLLPIHQYAVAGVYNVQLWVTSVDGCSDSITIPVTINAAPNVDAGPDQTVCNGVSVTLSGAGAVTYVWDNGVIDGESFIQPVGTVTYTVTGTGANGCINSDQVDVTVNPLPIINAGPDQSICDGEDVTLSGSGGDVYVWDNGVTDGVSFIPASGSNLYTVIGTDLNGCSSSDDVNVTVNALPVVDAGIDQTVCDGESITLSGTGAASYVWSNGVIDGQSFIQPVGTTTYSVIGTDINGCTGTDQVDVTVNPLPVIDAGLDQTVCEGVAVTLNGSGALAYTWDNGVLDGQAFVQAVGTITYTVTGTDANGCQNTDQVDVTVNPLPAVNAGPDQSICDGEDVTLSASGADVYVWDNGVTDGVSFTPPIGSIIYTVIGTDLNGCSNSDAVNVIVNALPVIDAGPDQSVCDGTTLALSGSGGVSYVWSNGIIDEQSFVQPVGSMTYAVIGTDINGCTGTDQLEIVVNALPTVLAGVDQQICEGATITLTGGGASTYVWDNGVLDGQAFVQAVGTVTYTVTGTDANGCQNIDQVDVTVNPLPTINAGPDQSICDGEDVTLSANGGDAYVWDNGVTDGVSFTPTIGSILYTVIGTDLNGCSNSDEVNVTVNALPVIDAGPDQSVCDGTTVTLSGSGGVSYVWSNGIIDGQSFVQPAGSMTYGVIGTDVNGCTGTDQVEIVVNVLPTVHAGVDQQSCDGTAITLSGGGASTYVWDNGVIDGQSFVQALGTVTYSVIGTDANGCVNSDQVDVTVNPLPTIEAGPDQIVCVGASVVLSGSGGVSYAWDHGVIDQVSFVPALGNLTYTVIGTDANGCANSDQVDVLANALPIVDAGVDQTVCDGVSVILSGSGVSSYHWNYGVVDNAPFVPGIGNHTFTVMGTDINGCQNIDSVDVNVLALPMVDAGPDQEVCEGTYVTFSGSGATSYVWTGGITDGLPFMNAVGQYSFIVTGVDANMCSNKDTVQLTVNPRPVVIAGANQIGCEGEQMTLNAIGSSNLCWNNGVFNGVPFTQNVGMIMYTVTDTLSTGCTASDSMMVQIHPNPNISAENKEICEGEGVTLEGSGATSYSWSHGIIDGNEFFPIQSDEYTVIGSSMYGCIDSAKAKVTVNPNPIIDFRILNLSMTTVNSTSEFENLSTGAVSYEWDFGDGSPISTDFEPMHTFPSSESGNYEITLTGYSEYGCPGEKRKYVYVLQDYTIYVPNTFTPDANGMNEIFKPVMEGFDEDEYTMYIFNRWGEIVFESHDMNVGWNGSFGRNGKTDVQDGVYTWKIEAGLKDSSDSKIFVGHVSLLK